MSAFERLHIDPKAAFSRQKCSNEQHQTKDSFAFKWSRRDTYESESVKEVSCAWLFERYCSGNPRKLADWLAGERKIILDAGCGAGFAALLFFGEHLKHHDYLGIDISDAVDVARERFAERDIPGDFLQCSIFDLPVPDNSFDIIFSEGVLHHTDSTERAVGHLAAKVRPGGRLLFYVYARKAIVREFTDDHIRERLSGLTDEQAWEALAPLTKLGKALGELNVDVDVPENVPLLGIKKGKLDIQRFFYWNICKAFYRADWTIEEMNHVNFDWFRPLNCHRQTPEQVRRWINEAGLELEEMNVQEAGITVVARKPLGETMP